MTTKGSDRKTSRRASAKSKRYHKKKATHQINVLATVAGAYAAAQVLLTHPYGDGRDSAVQILQVREPYVDRLQAAMITAKAGLEENIRPIAAAAAVAIASEWAGRNTKIGRRWALKVGDFKVKLL